MRKAVGFFALAFLSVPVIAAEPQNDQDKTLYALGVAMSKVLPPFNSRPQS